MVHSLMIRQILELIIETDKYEAELTEQVRHLTDTKYQYTGHGVFVYFSITEAGEKFRLSRDEYMLSELKISSSELVHGAEALLFIKSGLIKHLDIMAMGPHYPERELNDYILFQDWPGSPGRSFEKK